MKTDWDYTDRAHTYDQRADYSVDAISHLLKQTGCNQETPVADIGAGTGKLTKMLLSNKLTVRAVEPNDNMRMYGIKNTADDNAIWTEGVGEKTGLDDSCVYAAFFGSSFNVVDQVKTLDEVARIVVPTGWFGCMWNHRDVDDPIQKEIEEIIKSFIPNYDYGLRRQDPTAVIESHKHFASVRHIEERFLVSMKKIDIVNAWRSHDTLYRQSNGRFDDIIDNIAECLNLEEYLVPYFTRIWFAQCKIETNN
jgi:ubiquinone/menaquinone biosynthesis C-methylase UbiE